MSGTSIELAVASEIGRRVKAARQAAGLRQKQLAAMADCHHHTIMNMERGNYVPLLSNLIRVAVALDVPLASFVEAL